MGQSPIELYETDALPLANAKQLLEIDYPKTSKFSGTFKVQKHHPNFELTRPKKGELPELRFRGTKYELAKIHLHNHPEHIVGEGEQAQFEIHLIHLPKEGGAAPSPMVVIGILYSPNGKGHKKGFKCLCDKDIKINPLDFFPLKEDGEPDLENWYHYEGSLTTFPFSENVSWFVMRDQGNVTHDEIAPLGNKVTQHHREIQPLDRRLVVRSF